MAETAHDLVVRGGLVADGRIDITPMLTHRFDLPDWFDALKAIARQDQSGALKVAFTPNRN